MDLDVDWVEIFLEVAVERRLDVLLLLSAAVEYYTAALGAAGACGTGAGGGGGGGAVEVYALLVDHLENVDALEDLGPVELLLEPRHYSVGMPSMETPPR